MKRAIIRTAAIGLVLAGLPGCMLDLLMGAAIQGELAGQAAQTGARAMDRASDASGETTLRQAIQAYKAETGLNPPSLAALIPEFLGSIPIQSNGQPFGYDSASGQILTGAAASGPTSADNEKLQRIQTAINAYAQATRYYPASLDQLSPLYMGEIPKTDGGQAFRYDPNTGQAAFPAMGGSSMGAMAPGGAAGGSLMTETMTGMGMQQQLNNMNQSGTNAASGRMRNNARNIGAGHDERTNNTMNQLGL